jgi:hypothetical protein
MVTRSLDALTVSRVQRHSPPSRGRATCFRAVVVFVVIGRVALGRP